MPNKIGPRREGDVARSLASVDKVERFLGWKAKLDVADMCRITWNWQSTNDNDYLLECQRCGVCSQVYSNQMTFELSPSSMITIT